MVTCTDRSRSNFSNPFEDFTGTPDLMPLKGTWGTRGTYEIAVDLDNIYKTNARITCDDIEKGCPVKWDFPIVDKEKFKKILRDTPNTSFEVHVRRNGSQYEVLIKSPEFQDTQHFLKCLNAENFTEDSWQLRFHRNWIKDRAVDERKKLLENIILQSETDDTLQMAGANAKVILAGL